MISKLKTFVFTVFLIGLLPSVSLADSATKDLQYSDTWLEAKLVTTYALNKHLSVWDLEVDVDKQVATIAGEVDDKVKQDLAGEVAKSIEGIKGVNNNVKVANKKEASKKQTAPMERSFGQQIDDMTTTASIKSRLLLNSSISGLDIDVDTFKDTVTLIGTVRSEEEKALIEQIAANTSDVTEVKSELVIKKS